MWGHGTCGRVVGAEVQRVVASSERTAAPFGGGAEAKALGRGGVTAAARAAGISRPTVQRAMVELSEPPEGIAPARSRRAGGGRKRAIDLDPGLIDALEALVDPDSRGDPESPLRWTTKSTRDLADTLTEPSPGLR